MKPTFLAQITNPVLTQPGFGSGTNDQGVSVIGKIISAVAGLFFLFSFFLTFLYLLTGGVSWLTSGGDKAKLAEARDKITNAIIGLVIVAAAYAIFALVGQFFGLDVKALKIPSFSGN